MNKIEEIIRLISNMNYKYEDTKEAFILYCIKELKLMVKDT